MRSKLYLLLITLSITIPLLAQDDKRVITESTVVTSTMIDPEKIVIPKELRTREFLDLSKDLPLANNVRLLSTMSKTPPDTTISDVQLGKKGNEPVWVKLATPKSWSQAMTAKILTSDTFVKFQKSLKIAASPDIVMCAPNARRTCTKTCEKDDGTTYCCEWSCQ